jgi:SAM-dependent methyltransferase
VKLNIGCGRNILKDWINVDSVELPGVDIVANLETCGDHDRPLFTNIADNTVDEILCSHVLEHIRNILPLMQELWRVAKPGAFMTVRVPYGSSDDAWEDPTHVRAFYLQSFGYFSQPYYWRASYNFRGDFQPEKIVLIPQVARWATASHFFQAVNERRNVVAEMVATLRAVKPARQPLRELQHLPELVMG